MKLHFKSVFFASFIFLSAFCLLAVSIQTKIIRIFDKKTINFVQGFETPLLTNIMKFFTFIGSTKVFPILMILVLVLLSRILKQKRERILLVIAALGSNAIFITLKFLFQRERPDFHRLIEVSGYSFPSGHATNALALYSVLIFILWSYIPTIKGRVVTMLLGIVMIIMIGTSRVYLGVHYPSDILGGFLISGFWITFIVGFYQKSQKENYDKEHSILKTS